MNCQAPGCTATAAHIVAKHGVALGRVCYSQQCVAALVGSTTTESIGADPTTDLEKRLAQERRDEDFSAMLRTLQQLSALRTQAPSMRPIDVLNRLLLVGNSIEDTAVADIRERLTNAMRAVMAEMNMLLDGQPYDANVGKRQAKLLTNLIANRTTLAKFDETLKGSEEMEKAKLPADVRMLAAIRVDPIQVIAELPSHLTIDEVRSLRRGSPVLRASSTTIGIPEKNILFDGTQSKNSVVSFGVPDAFNFSTPTQTWSGKFDNSTDMWTLTTIPSGRYITLRDFTPQDTFFFKSQPYFIGFSIAGNIIAAIERPRITEDVRVELFRMDFPDPSSAPATDVSRVEFTNRYAEGKLTPIGAVTLEGTTQYIRNQVAVDENGNVWYCNPVNLPAIATDIIVKSPSNVIIARRNNVFPVALTTGASGGMWVAIDRSPDMGRNPFNNPYTTKANVVYQHMRLATL